MNRGGNINFTHKNLFNWEINILKINRTYTNNIDHWIMQARRQKCCHIKLWRIIEVSSISHVFNIICILFYCGLYSMAIDVVTWRIIKKWCIWSLHLCNFLWLVTLLHTNSTIAILPETQRDIAENSARALMSLRRAPMSPHCTPMSSHQMASVWVFCDVSQYFKSVLCCFTMFFKCFMMFY